MYGYIYKTTDLTTNKIYIGKHKATCFEGMKYVGSGTIISRIKNYCIKNNIPLSERLQVDLLDTAESLQELNEKEIYYISSYCCTDSSIGYNFAHGGDGGPTTTGFIKITNGVCEKVVPKDYILPEGWTKGCTTIKEKNYNYNKEFRWINNSFEEKRIQLSDEIPAGYVEGRLLTLSETAKQQISESRKNNPITFSEETLEFFSQNWKGENNPSVKNKKYGENNSFYGLHHSESAKKANSEKHKIKYKCPFCDYVSNHGSITKHINKTHTELLKSASTIESITYEKYIGE